MTPTEPTTTFKLVVRTPKERAAYCEGYAAGIKRGAEILDRTRKELSKEVSIADEDRKLMMEEAEGT